MSTAPTQRAARPCALITGSAAGIGLAIAERLAAQGWLLGLYDIQGDAAQAQALRLQAQGGPVHTGGQLDVTDANGWARVMADFTAHTGGRLDVLVNNAGIAVAGPFEDATLAQHQRMVAVNVNGVINGCHTALPHLRRQPGARIINLCSASAIFGQPCLATYSATKAAVRNLTEGLDTELSHQGVRVVDVLPLFVDTAMVRNEVAKMPTAQRMGVQLTADDVARVVLKLATKPAGSLAIHNTVGWRTAVLALASKLSPAGVNKWVTQALAGSR
jgi:NAD(P)-dependent dehydrogenase (short-subunit alcohol dehydrogenase family)